MEDKKSLNILVVEDEWLIRSTAARELKARGHKVTELADIDEAYEHLGYDKDSKKFTKTENIPDVVLTDNNTYSQSGRKGIDLLTSMKDLEIGKVLHSADFFVEKDMQERAGANVVLVQKVSTHEKIARAVESSYERRFEKLPEVKEEVGGDKKTNPDALNIVVVEHDLIIGEAREISLRDRGHKVSRFETADEGIAAIKKNKPDAIIVSREFDGEKSGFDLLAEFKNDNIATVFVSGMQHSQKEIEKIGGEHVRAPGLPITALQLMDEVHKSQSVIDNKIAAQKDGAGDIEKPAVTDTQLKPDTKLKSLDFVDKVKGFFGIKKS